MTPVLKHWWRAGDNIYEPEVNDIERRFLTNKYDAPRCGGPRGGWGVCEVEMFLITCLIVCGSGYFCKALDSLSLYPLTMCGLLGQFSPWPFLCVPYYPVHPKGNCYIPDSLSNYHSYQNCYEPHKGQIYLAYYGFPNDWHLLIEVLIDWKKSLII